MHLNIGRPVLLLTLLGTMLLGASPALKYRPFSFHDMVIKTDLAVLGKIVEVGEQTFIVQVEIVLAGELPTEAEATRQLEVIRFGNWACASRWAEYAVGQEVVLFLAKRTGETGGYWIMSGGGEGEMPILESEDEDGHTVKSVVVRGRDTMRIGELGAHRVLGGRAYGVATELNDFVTAVRGLHECYAFAPDPSSTERRKAWNATKRVHETRIAKLAKQSPIARLLVNEARALR